MQITNIHEAKTRLAQLIERGQAGEEFIIGKAGVPVAKLIRYDEGDTPRQPGFWRGKVGLPMTSTSCPNRSPRFSREETNDCFTRYTCVVMVARW